MRMMFGFACMDRQRSPDREGSGDLLDIAQFAQSFDDQSFVFGADHLFRFAGGVRGAWFGGFGRRLGDNGIRRGLILGLLLHSYTWTDLAKIARVGGVGEGAGYWVLGGGARGGRLENFCGAKPK